MTPETKKRYIRISSTYVPIIGLTMMAIMVLVERCEGKANAQTLRFIFGETWGVAWTPDGKQTEPPVNSLFGVGMGFKIAESWTLFGDIITTTPMTEFHPTLRPTLGFAFRYGLLTLGASIMCQWNPGYEGSDHSYMLGVTVGPGFVITEGVVVTLGAGYRMKLQGGELVAHILSPGAGLTFLFPL